MVGLKAFDRPDYPVPGLNKREFKKFMAFLGLERGIVSPLSPDMYSQKVSVNGEANPGPSFLRQGVRSKRRAVGIAKAWLDEVVSGKISTNDLPPVLWGLGGRGKPTNISKVLEKHSSCSAVGRAVWMADTHESVFGWRYQQPLTEFFIELNGVINLDPSGKVSRNREEMKSFLDGVGVSTSGDWIKFDSNVQSDEIDFAFDVMRYAFNVRKGSIDDDILLWLQCQMIFSTIVTPDGKKVQKSTGVPSGSSLTILVDSIVNARRLWASYEKFRRRMRLPRGRFRLKVTGDDNLEKILYPGNFRKRWRFGKSWLKFVAEEGERVYHAGLNYDKCGVSVDPFVRYRHPKVTSRVADHSRAYLRNRKVYKIVGGRAVLKKPEELWAVTRDIDEIIYNQKHGVKRFEYSVSGAASYCSTYYLADGSQIRPKKDVMDRLACTSAYIGDVYKWRELLLQYLIEFWTNVTARAELLSMFLDSFQMEEEGIVTFDDAINNIANLESGALDYPARTYIRDNIGGRAVSPNIRGRQFWMACADWWPGRATFLELGLSAQWEAINRIIGSVYAGSGLRGIELFRIRKEVVDKKKTMYARELDGKIRGILAQYAIATRRENLELAPYVDPFLMAEGMGRIAKDMCPAMSSCLTRKRKRGYIHDGFSLYMDTFTFKPGAGYHIEPVEFLIQC
jgi:hypothetical protein